MSDIRFKMGAGAHSSSFIKTRTMIRHVTFIVLIGSSGCKLSQSVSDIEKLIRFDAQKGMQLGRGISTVDLAIKSTCVAVPDTSKFETTHVNKSMTPSYRLIETAEGLRSALNISIDVDIAAKMTGATGNAKLDIMKNIERHRKKNSVIFVVSNQVIRETVNLPSASLKITDAVKNEILCRSLGGGDSYACDEATLTDENYAENLQVFYNHCGDEYISSVTYGSEYLGILEFEAQNSEEKKTILGSLATKLKSKVISADASGGVEGDSTTISKASGLKFNFWSHQEGGNFSHLTGGIGANNSSNQTNIQAQNTSGVFDSGSNSLAQIIRSMIQAANDLGKTMGTKNKGNILTAQTSKYMDLATTVPKVVRAKIEQASEVVSQDVRKMTTLLHDRASIVEVDLEPERFLRVLTQNGKENVEDVSAQHSNEIQSALQDIDQRINTVKLHINSCKQDLAKCSDMAAVKFEETTTADNIKYIRKKGGEDSLNFMAKMRPIFCSLPKEGGKVVVKSLDVTSTFGSEIALTLEYETGVHGSGRGRFSFAVNSYFVSRSFFKRINILVAESKKDLSFWQKVKGWFSGSAIEIRSAEAISIVKVFATANSKKMFDEQNFPTCSLTR